MNEYQKITIATLRHLSIYLARLCMACNLRFALEVGPLLDQRMCSVRYRRKFGMPVQVMVSLWVVDKNITHRTEY